jgi:hypothetical protein
MNRLPEFKYFIEERTQFYFLSSESMKFSYFSSRNQAFLERVTTTSTGLFVVVEIVSLSQLLIQLLLGLDNGKQLVSFLVKFGLDQSSELALEDAAWEFLDTMSVIFPFWDWVCASPVDFTSNLNESRVIPAKHR